MFKFIAHGVLERFIPTPLQKLLAIGNHNHSMYAAVPPELLDKIIDHLHDDKITLRALSLVCKQTLTRSRSYLVSYLEFNFNDSDFDMFLTLLDTPWTSFAFAVKSLRLQFLFQLRDYEHHPNKNFLRITANLPNLKALSLTMLRWDRIPPHIQDFFFQLNITDLQLDSVLFRPPQNNHSEFAEFLRRLQPSLETISMYDLRFDPIHHNLSAGGSLSLQRHIHFTTLDSTSLVLFNDMWDPAINKDFDVTVESFHLHLLSLTPVDRKLNTPFISRFLHHIGKSLRRLIINISSPYFQSEVLPYLESVDLSQCINVRVVHIGIITLDQVSFPAGKTSLMLLVMWKLLSNLPPDLIVEIFLTFSPCSVADLESFAWLELIARLQKMFRYLKKIVIRDVEGYPRYSEVLRQSGMRRLEEEGVVSFDMTSLDGHGFKTFEPWRESTNSF